MSARFVEVAAHGPDGARVLSHRFVGEAWVRAAPTYGWPRYGGHAVVQGTPTAGSVRSCEGEDCVTEVAVFGANDVRTWSRRGTPTGEVVWALRDGRFVSRSEEGI